MILLDTNIVVAYLNGNNWVASKVVENINKIGLTPSSSPSLITALRFLSTTAETW
jgi:predicted nucleic-acid-binding protein